MPLDHAAAKLATDWINQKAPLLRCQGCGSDQWNLGELAAAISVPNHAPGPAHIIMGPGRPGVPGTQAELLLPVACRLCGLTVFFSPVMMGIVPPSQAGGAAPATP